MPVFKGSTSMKEETRGKDNDKNGEAVLRVLHLARKELLLWTVL